MNDDGNVAIGESTRIILLDLDGTLLDRNFDDYFWEELLPERFARNHGISFKAAREDLLARFRREEGNLRWTDLDFWSDDLGIDITALKEEYRHLIVPHPCAIPFLSAARPAGKKLVLVTNAHPKTLDIKLRQTGIGPLFDHIVTSDEMGFPKEDARFWLGLEKKLGAGYGEESLLVDDTEAVLTAAAAYGVRRVLLRVGGNSTRPVERSTRFPYITSFRSLLVSLPEIHAGPG